MRICLNVDLGEELVVDALLVVLEDGERGVTSSFLSTL
jgi:hypothetical protein